MVFHVKKSVSFPLVHGFTELGPECLAESDTSWQVFLIEVDLDVADLDSSNFWDDDSSLKKDIKFGDVGVNSSLEKSLKLSWGKSEGSLESSTDSSGGGFTNITEDLASGWGDNGLGSSILEGSENSNLLVDGAGDLKGSSDGLSSGVHGGGGWGLNEFSSELNCDSLSVLGENWWDKNTEVISSNSDVQELGEDLGDIKGVSGGESRCEKRVNSVLGSEELSGFAFWVMKGEGSWWSSWHTWVFGIEECSIHSHLENVVSGELWASNLSVISGNASEEWDDFLISIDFEVVIDGGINKGLASGNSLVEDLWDDCALEKRDQQVGDLGDEAWAWKGDVNVLWVEVDSKFSTLNTWGKFTWWGSGLSTNVDISINSEFLDVDMNLTVDGEEEVFVMEITISGSDDLRGFKVGTVVNGIECNIDIVNIGLWNLDDKVLKITSIKIDLWDWNVLEGFKDIWGDDVLGFAHTILGDWNGNTGSLGGVGCVDNGDCVSW